MREYQRDGLRMLALHEPAQLQGVGLLDGLDVFVGLSSGLRKMFGNPLSAFGTKGVGQHFLGVVKPAARATPRRLSKFLKYGFGLIGRNLVETRYGLADGLHFLVIELLQNLAAQLVTERDQKNGRFLRTGDFRRCGFVQGHEDCQCASSSDSQPRRTPAPAYGFFLPLSCSWFSKTSVLERVSAGRREPSLAAMAPGCEPGAAGRLAIEVAGGSTSGISWMRSFFLPDRKSVV